MPSRKPPVSSSPSEDEELDIALIMLRAALRWKQNDLARQSGIGFRFDHGRGGADFGQCLHALQDLLPEARLTSRDL